MENAKNKKSSKKDETKNKIPSDSLLGQMLKYWFNNSQTKGKKKQQMIKYCCFI
jgi:uncharacterized protein YccT (UPF0319 family)